MRAHKIHSVVVAKRKQLEDFIHKFDEGEKVEPFEFELPDEMVALNLLYLPQPSGLGRLQEKNMATFKRIFEIEVEFTQEEMQAAADVYGVSIEQLTDDQIRQCFENALTEEFEGIILMPANLTPAPQE